MVGGVLVETVPGPAAVVSTVTALSWWGDAEQSRRDVGGSWLWEQHGHRAVIMIIRTSDILGDDIEVAIKVINNILIQCVWAFSIWLFAVNWATTQSQQRNYHSLLSGWFDIIQPWTAHIRTSKLSRFRSEISLYLMVYGASLDPFLLIVHFCTFHKWISGQDNAEKIWLLKIIDRNY